MQQHQLEQQNIDCNKLSSLSQNNFPTFITFDREKVDNKEKIRLKKLKKIQKRKQKKKQRKQIESINHSNNNNNFLDNKQVANQQKQQQRKQLEQVSITRVTKLQDIGFVVYQQQFDMLFNWLSQYVNNCASSQELMHANQNKQNNILIVGPHQSGRRHLLNQTLIKLHCHYLSPQPNTIKLNIIKRFINQEQNQQQIVQNEQKEQQNQHKQHISMSSLSSINLVVKFISDSKKLLQKQKQLLQEYQQNNHYQYFNLVINVYFITNLQYSTNWVDTQNIHLLVQIPQPIHFTTNHIQRLQHFLIYQLRQIQYQVNTNSIQSVHIQYSNTVIAFTIKFLIKKHQQDTLRCCHPILAMRYLNNYLQNYFRSQLNSIQSNQTQQQNQTNISVTLKLSTPTITTFLNSLLSANHQNPITTISLSSLIFPHQLLLISCYLYLTSTQYLNALYINGLKLYQYFIIAQQALMIEKIEEKIYWQGLEKLKDLGVLKFVEDIKYKQQNRNAKNKRSSNNIKYIKDYKNHNFYLAFGIDKIKQDLQDMEIYAKFFIKQNQQ